MKVTLLDSTNYELANTEGAKEEYFGHLIDEFRSMPLRSIILALVLAIDPPEVWFDIEEVVNAICLKRGEVYDYKRRIDWQKAAQETVNKFFDAEDELNGEAS